MEVPLYYVYNICALLLYRDNVTTILYWYLHFIMIDVYKYNLLYYVKN